MLASMSEAGHGVQGGTNAGLRAWGIGEVVSLGATAKSKTKQVCVVARPHLKSQHCITCILFLCEKPAWKSRVCGCVSLHISHKEGITDLQGR